MTTDELYEKSLIQRLNEVERTREWLECELREVRNRLQRKRSQQKMLSTGQEVRLNLIIWGSG